MGVEMYRFIMPGHAMHASKIIVLARWENFVKIARVRNARSGSPRWENARILGGSQRLAESECRYEGPEREFQLEPLYRLYRPGHWLHNKLVVVTERLGSQVRLQRKSAAASGGDWLHESVLDESMRFPD